MSGELMNYATGTSSVQRYDRRVAAQAKRVHDEVRLAAFKSDGALGLAGHIMDGVVGLDTYRRMLSKDDPITTALLADIEQQAMFQVKRIQANLFNDWGL